MGTIIDKAFEEEERMIDLQNIIDRQKTGHLNIELVPKGYALCQKCDGEGSVKDQICLKCKGEGIINGLIEIKHLVENDEVCKSCLTIDQYRNIIIKAIDMLVFHK